ncbi:hypothetical protein ACNKHV_00390 [Shigella flexneri]
MRTLLNTMQDRGGRRGKRKSGVEMLASDIPLYRAGASTTAGGRRLLEQDRIDQLVQLVGDKATVRQMLVFSSGRQLSPRAAHPARALLSSVA